ncbi:reactive intermediate/imine deaminase [Sutterella faecalis]|uniref:Reactive intermediate/imine deaminase n=2 Tax=Sutterella TaxID=40544 RepID=A0AAI9SFR4_9BURK|nr:MULTISPECIES: Rid family detoxifying hydrolase [Sutterella]KAB7652794.1 reactive intermediate/imine deaminase [Sutterella seckii]QDA54295.1 reactive intermediate/imine deaminase [Sutterella faecalis]
MTKFSIAASPAAPKALGHYVQGVRSGNLIITSGQIPLVPETGALVKEPAEAMRQVLSNLTAIVEDAGGSKDTIARVDIYVTDLKDFPAMNAAYAEFFGTHKPARFCAEVKGLPAGAVLEASVMAFAAD